MSFATIPVRAESMAREAREQRDAIFLDPTESVRAARLAEISAALAKQQIEPLQAEAVQELQRMQGENRLQDCKARPAASAVGPRWQDALARQPFIREAGITILVSDNESKQTPRRAEHD
jgi:hypothetical protein